MSLRKKRSRWARKDKYAGKYKSGHTSNCSRSRYGIRYTCGFNRRRSSGRNASVVQRGGAVVVWIAAVDEYRIGVDERAVE
jgi:hypothetical protein